MADSGSLTKPRFRGVSHEWACLTSVFLGLWLTLNARTARSRLAVAIYAITLVALFGTSALYHRVNWHSKKARRWMRRLDHSMIFMLIAGTYTPFSLLVLHGALAPAVLLVVWTGALAGILFKVAWIGAPKWLIAVVFLALGWMALVTLPQIGASLGLGALLMLVAGGLLYTLGAIVYATQWPDPSPRVFGYHEVFHALVIAAAALQWAVIAFFVLPL